MTYVESYGDDGVGGVGGASDGEGDGAVSLGFAERRNKQDGA
jgi:hypothetical protein